MATENISISTHTSLQFQVIKTQNPLKKESKNLNVLTPKFERHPSAAKLLNSEEQEIKEIPIISNDGQITPCSAPASCPFTIVLNESGNPLYDKNDNFYIKSNYCNIDKSKTKEKRKQSLVNNVLWAFTPSQLKLDQKVTECIRKGENFETINKMFNDYLIKKE